MGEPDKGGKPRATVTHAMRKYRIDKTRPRKTTTITREDYGTHEYITTVTNPITAKKTESVIPKRHNPHLIWIIKEPIRIIYYTDTEKCFIYDEDKMFLGALEIHDLKHLFFKIGSVLRLRKHPQRISNLSYSKKEET